VEKATFFGTIAVSVLLAASIMMAGSLKAFYDVPSIMIVIGGGLFSMFIAYNTETVKKALYMIKQAYMAPDEFDYLKIISTILSTADVARKEGVLALDAKMSEIDNEYMRRALQMVVDGVDVGIIEDILMTEVDATANRHTEVKGAIDFFGASLPAFGMIGTILGLVLLLGNLDDPAAIGPNMAVALITTFYGAVAANVFFIPLGKKVDQRNNIESLYLEIIARGCLMIASGTHPRIIQERLLAYVSQKDRGRFNEIHLAKELKE
jgi:chemotaxis protein MotA